VSTRQTVDINTFEDIIHLGEGSVHTPDPARIVWIALRLSLVSEVRVDESR